jgi:predicted transcriptional regulator
MTMKCTKCNGTGEAQLPLALQETYLELLAAGPSTVPQLYELLPDFKAIRPTAANRRVERLVALGLVRKVAKTSPARYEVVK